MENFNIRETQASNLIKEIPKKDFILFDFSNGYFCRNNIIRTELIGRKIQKYHNLDKSLLFLVGTRWPYQKTIRELPRVINNNNSNISTQNTFLINPSLFSRLVGLEGESLRNFNNIISFNFITGKYTVLLKNVDDYYNFSNYKRYIFYSQKNKLFIKDIYNEKTAK